MPIANRCVLPVCVSQIKVPEAVENEFEYIVNATLSNFIKQIACMTIKAKDIFDELTVSLSNIVDRSFILESKIEDITAKLKINDSLPIQPLVGQQIEVYKMHINRDDELLVHTEMPDCIRELFDEAEPPPQLDKFDEFRKEEIESMKFYTDPEFFLREWLKNVRVEKKKRKEKKKKKPAVLRSENLPLQPPPSIINSVVQESTIDENTTNYNYGDVSEYEDPRNYRRNNEITSFCGEITNVISENEINNLPPPPPPPPLPPPPPAPAPVVIFSNVHSNIPPLSPAAPEADSIQSLLRDIQKGAVLKPVTANSRMEDKRKTKDFRAMIAELRPAWDNNSDESDESEED